MFDWRRNVRLADHAIEICSWCCKTRQHLSCHAHVSGFIIMAKPYLGPAVVGWHGLENNVCCMIFLSMVLKVVGNH